MNWFKENRFKVFMATVVLTIALSATYFYFSYFRPHSMLLDRFNKFSDMISVGLCKEAYDQFITKSSMANKGYDNFLAHCNYRRTKWGDLKIQTTVYTDYYRSDIKYTFDLSVPDLDNQKYKDCIRFNEGISPLPLLVGTYEFCSDYAPQKIVKSDSIETWIFEAGLWKRDY